MRLAWHAWRQPLQRSFALFGVGLLLSGCTDAPGGDKCEMARVAELPLEWKDGNLVVAGKLNGSDVSLLFDTGANETVIDKQVTVRRSAALVSEGYFIGIGGEQGRYRFLARSFQVGTLHGKDLEMAAIETLHGDSDGILGDNFLARYDIDLDFGDSKAILYKAIAHCSHPSVVMQGSLYAVPMFMPPASPYPAAIINVEIGGKRFRALVDSGATTTVIYRNAARRLGLRIADLTADPHFKSHGIGNHDRDAVTHVMTPVSIGDLTVLNMPVGIIDERSDDEEDMLLGLDFLFRVHVWLSFSSRTVIMEYPPRSSPAAPPT